MEKLSYYMNIFCSSFTISTLLITGMNLFSGTESMNILWIFKMAFLCFLISALMFVTDVITEKLFGRLPVWLFILIGITEVMACVFGLGLMWGWFTFGIEGLIEVIVIDLIIYFGVYGITYISEKKRTDKINELVKNRRKKNGKDN